MFLLDQAESDQDVAVTSSEEDLPISSHGALGKLRLPRSLLEKWVEEPFFEKAVIGCFVRLGVGAHSLTKFKRYVLSLLQAKRQVYVEILNTKLLVVWCPLNAWPV